VSIGGDTTMKAVLHGLALLTVVTLAALCAFVQVDHVSDALEVFSSRAASAE
jgi:hypothetical protein